MKPMDLQGLIHTMKDLTHYIHDLRIFFTKLDSFSNLSFECAFESRVCVFDSKSYFEKLHSVEI